MRHNLMAVTRMFPVGDSRRKDVPMDVSTSATKTPQHMLKARRRASGRVARAARKANR